MHVTGYNKTASEICQSMVAIGKETLVSYGVILYILLVSHPIQLSHIGACITEPHNMSLNSEIVRPTKTRISNSGNRNRIERIKSPPSHPYYVLTSLQLLLYPAKVQNTNYNSSDLLYLLQLTKLDIWYYRSIQFSTAAYVFNSGSLVIMYLHMF